jgi:acetylornithine deacetylase/succinyl-diaminopimelate desuccinylase-like protein
MAIPPIPESDWPGLQDEALGLLQQLIRLPTINPDDQDADDAAQGIKPVPETEACKAIRAILAAEGIASIIAEKPDDPNIAKTPGERTSAGRGNIVARLPGDGSRRAVVLAGHLDVAGVTAETWRRAKPFAATVVDGRLYGRGAADMKNLVTMHLMAVLAAKRYRIPLKRDLILVGNADEEAGSKFGMHWLADARRYRDALTGVEVDWDNPIPKAEFAFNEGAMGSPFAAGVFSSMRGPASGTPTGAPTRPDFVGLETTEKRILAFKVSAKGAPGHASSLRPDNPIYALAAALVRLRDTPPPMVLNPVTERLLRAFITRFGRDLKQSPASWVQAMLRDVVVPTVVKAGDDIGVTAAGAEALVICRLLPTTDVAAFRAWLEDVLGAPGIALEFPYGVPGDAPAPADFASPAIEAYRASVERHFGAGIPLLPMQGIATTDNAPLRGLGITAYGVRPMFDPHAQNMHGNDESISVDGFRTGVRMFVEAVLDLAS